MKQHFYWLYIKKISSKNISIILKTRINNWIDFEYSIREIYDKYWNLKNEINIKQNTLHSNSAK
jgi:hypothetical protein